MKWEHDALAADLAAHLRTNTEVIAWEDMQLGPSGSPRPDVFSMRKSYSRFVPLAYEVKVSKADFRSDVTSGKWQKYLEYAAGVIFAAPAGLISKDELPAGCGLIQRSDTGWRMLKAPTLAPIKTLPHKAWQKLLIDGIKDQVSRTECRQRPEPNIWSVQQRLRYKYGDDIAQLVARAVANREALEAEIANKQEQIEQVRNETHRQVRRAIEKIEQGSMLLKYDLRELADALGLELTATPHELAIAVREAARRLDRDAELKRMRSSFRKIHELAGELAENFGK